MDLHAAIRAERSVPPISPAWHERIAAAGSERDLVTATREWLVGWTPRELGQLPEDCRPGRIVDGEDINRWALHFTHAHLERRMSPELERLIAPMHAFFVQAATRLGEVARADSEAT